MKALCLSSPPLLGREIPLLRDRVRDPPAMISCIGASITNLNWVFAPASNMPEGPAHVSIRGNPQKNGLAPVVRNVKARLFIVWPGRGAQRRRSGVNWRAENRKEARNRWERQ